MNPLLAWIACPLALLVLCAGLGLLVDRVSGRRLTGALVVPAGLAATVALGGLADLAGVAAEVAVPILFLLAALGGALSNPWRFGRPEPLPLLTAVGVYAALALSGEPGAGLRLEADLAWAFPPFLAFLAAAAAACLWQLAEAAVEGRPGLAAASVLVVAVAAAPVWVNLLGDGDGLPSYDRLAERQEVDEEFGVEPTDGDLDALELEAVLARRTIALPRSPTTSRPPQPYRLVRDGEYYEVWRRPAEPSGPILHHMGLGNGERAGPPNCSQVVGLGLLALSNQLGYPAQSVVLVAAAPDGSLVIAGIDEARGLCDRRWDWIEAVGAGRVELPSP